MPASTPPSRKPAPRLRSALALIALCFTASCSAPPSRVPELLAHPEFPIAAQTAPAFTKAALDALVDAEARAK